MKFLNIPSEFCKFIFVPLIYLLVCSKLLFIVSNNLFESLLPNILSKIKNQILSH